MGLEIAFWVLTVVAVAAALAVVSLHNIFRAALALILCFLAVAGLFVTLSADFLAAIQVLIYVGAVAVLIILAIMLTREVQRGSFSNRLNVPVLLSAILFLGVAVFAVMATSWPVVTLPPLEATTTALGSELFGEGGYILPVEISALLLLVVIIGAITMVREK